jgi:hypothetical protein
MSTGFIQISLMTNSELHLDPTTVFWQLSCSQAYSKNSYHFGPINGFKQFQSSQRALWRKFAVPETYDVQFFYCSVDLKPLKAFWSFKKIDSDCLMDKRKLCIIASTVG